MIDAVRDIRLPSAWPTAVSARRPLKPITTQAEQQLALEVKRLYLRNALPGLTVATDPTVLWNAILEHRYVSSKKSTAAAEDNNDAVQYDDLRLTYEGYRAAAHHCIFSTKAEDVKIGDGNMSAQLTDEEKRQIYFSHPFLSPQTFLMFPRDEVGAVPAVQLYAFVAKKLLLFRLRVILELAATVPPPQLHLQQPDDSGAAAVVRPARCRPSASSPLSNALSAEDVEGFISQLLSHLRIVRDMPPWMKPYYLCHAARKFFFMCDPRNTGSISVDDFMSSDVFSELLRIYESDLRDAVTVYPVGCLVQVPVNVVATAWRRQATGAADEDDGQLAFETSIASEEDCVEGVVVSIDGDGNDLNDTYTINVEFRSTSINVQTTREHVHWSPLSAEMPGAAGAGGGGGGDDHPSMRENWFSLRVMNRVYEHFTELDADADGVLTLDEFKKYSNSSFTELAMTRVFECHVPRGATTTIAATTTTNDGAVTENEQEQQQNVHAESHMKEDGVEGCGEQQQVVVPVMDYKTYLNFVLGSELACTIPGAKYLWRLINLDDAEKVPLHHLRFFCKEIADQLVLNGLMTDISIDSIMSEVVDMINPEDREGGGVTFGDLMKSNQCGTVLPILVNFRNFYAYDCREQNIVQAADTEEFVTSS